jgi:hypothetical protein
MAAANDRERLKREYWKLSERRFGYLETVKRERAVWNGQGPKPPRLIVAEDMLVRLDVRLTLIAEMMGGAAPKEPETTR